MARNASGLFAEYAKLLKSLKSLGFTDAVDGDGLGDFGILTAKLSNLSDRIFGENN